MLTRRRRILLAMAMPGALFHADRKARALSQRLAPLIDQGLVSLDVELAARADQLQRVLRHRRPDVLHVVCHGESSSDGRRVLRFEDRKGQPRRLGADELGALVSSAGVRLELVVLEACRSWSIAKALATHTAIDATLGLTEEIETAASTRFFLTFHEARASGRTIPEAFGDARRDLELLAPAIWHLPVLYGGSPSEVAAPSARGAAVAGLDIDPSRAERHVLLAGPLMPPWACHGRSAELQRLDEAWFEGGHPIVHLRGPAGVGKTTLVARWLELQAQRRWHGATRVFTWSFDPLAEGPARGTITEFLEQATDFFGAVEPTLSADEDHADDEGEWLDGLRLGRCVAREPALLCLDAVPLLPHRRTESHAPHELLPPAIAALLHELSRSRLAVCVMTTRASSALRMQGVLDRPLEVLDEDAAAELLGQRGIIAREHELRAVARQLDRRPGMLITLADAARGQVSPQSLLPLELGEMLTKLGGAETLLSALACSGGSLSHHELRAVAGLEHEPELDPTWEPFDDVLLRALRRVVALGLVRVTEPCELVLSEAAVLEHLPRATAEVGTTLAALAEAAVQAPLQARSEIPAYRRAMQLALQRGESGAADAVRIYVDRVCQRNSNRYGNAQLTRALGAVADDLWLLAELFVPSDDGSFAGKELRPGVAAAEPPGGAYLHHRLGLALRHLGRLREAGAPLRRAFEVYARSGSDREERAATCANDLAETLAWQGDLVGALEWATVAVTHAERAATHPSSSEPGQLVRFLSAATLAHVHDRRGEHAAAQQWFERAKEWVRAYDSSPLFGRLLSRPGYQYWCFLLGQIEQRLKDARHDEARVLGQELEEHLFMAEQWHEQGGPDLARVTRAYHALARGRLLLLAERHGLDLVESLRGRGLTRAEHAQKQLFYAVHVLRANQHLWMLPDALAARASLFEHLREHVGAALDRHEAEELRTSFLEANRGVACRP